MAEIKVGDRVKVEYEGTVTYVHRDQQVEVGGFGTPPEATVTVLRPEEPTGLGAVALVTYRDAVGVPRNYVTVRNSDGLWYSEENGWEEGHDLFGCDCDCTVEIVSQGVDLAP